MLLAWAQILTLPLDAGNTRGGGGGLEMDVMWQLIYMLVFVTVLFIIPPAMFWLECGDDENRTTCGKAWYVGWHMIFLVIICILILGILYATIATAYIPVQVYSCDASDMIRDQDDSIENECDESDIELEIPVTFPIFTVALMSFVGWILFVVYGGVGLAAIPMDLINMWRTRPERLTYDELNSKRSSLKLRSAALIQDGEAIRQKELDLNSGLHGWLKKRRLR